MLPLLQLRLAVVVGPCATQPHRQVLAAHPAGRALAATVKI